MRSDGRPSVIFLKSNEGTRYEEGRAAGAIKPGHLIKFNGDDELVVHSTSGGYAALLIATEEVQVLQGKGIDDNYADNDLVSYRPVSKADLLQVWLKDGQTADEGSLLSSNGDGTFKVVAGAEIPLMVAREARAAAGSDLRIKAQAV
jgi:hypothetical protein